MIWQLRILLRRFGSWLWPRINRPWLFWTAGALCLAAVIWFGGPLLGLGSSRPLETPVARAVLLAVLALAAAGWWGYKAWRLRKRNAAMVDALGDASRPDPTRQEEQAIASRMSAALDRLRSRTTGTGGPYVYELPWFAIIGMPGSGKTTALMNSGLQFPLADGAASPVIEGAGGTRFIDFWFADRAVLIDTAGRFTSQDSDAIADSAAWLAFLRLLREHRPLQPLSGLILTIPIAVLMQGSQALRQHVGVLRARLRDVQDELGIRLPVYLLLTKADQLAGFDESFDSLQRTERDQVWGITVPLSARDINQPAALSAGQLDALVARLSDHMLGRLHRETDLARRGRCFALTQELALMRPAMLELFDAMNSDSALDRRPLLRGLYLVSGTQEGGTIDRILRGLMPEIAPAPGPVRANSGRSYFVRTLLERVVLAEAGIASRNSRAEWRSRLVYGGSAALALGLLAAALTIWTHGFIENRAVMADLEQAIDAYRPQAAALSTAEVRAYDARAVRALSALRLMPGSSSLPPLESWPMLGLSQKRKLADQLDAIYANHLNAWFLPAVMLRLEGDLRAKLGTSDQLYEALRTYLMITNQGPMNRDAVMAWAKRDTEAMAQAEPGLPETEILAHIDAATLIARRPPAADGQLVARSRAVLAAEPVSVRLYALLKMQPLATRVRAWRPTGYLGPLGREALQLFDPAFEQVEVPGLFSREGYRVFIGLLAAQGGNAAEQIWVLGQRQEAGSESENSRLRADIARLYADEYVNRWRAVLDGMRIAPAADAAMAQRQLVIASGQTSPLRSLLRSIVETNNLVMNPEARSAMFNLLSGSRIGRDISYASRYSVLAKDLDPNLRAIDSARQSIVDYFQRLRLFVGTGTSSELDQSLQSLAAVAAKSGALAGVASGGGALAGGAAGQAMAMDAKAASAQLEQQASSGVVPEPMRGWMSGLARNASQSVTSSQRRQLGAALSATGGGSFCRQAIVARFPARLTEQDMRLDDFAQYFRPGGMADGFFAANLAPYVDTAQRPWRLTAEAQALGISPALVRQYERIGEIRQAFFAGQSSEPKVYFQMSLRTPDATAPRLMLTIGQQSATFDAETAPAKSFVWPDPFGAAGVSIEFADPAGGPPARRSWQGSWALFRMIAASRTVQRIGNDRMLVEVEAAGRRALLLIQATTPVNPFVSRALSQFQCPDRM